VAIQAFETSLILEIGSGASLHKLRSVSEEPRRRVGGWRIAGPIAVSSALSIVLGLSWFRHSRAPAFAMQGEMRGQIVEPLKADLAAVRSSLGTAGIPLGRAAELRTRLAGVEREIESIREPDPATFTTVQPLNPTHARILGVHGAIPAAGGLAPLVVWKTHRYDAVPFLAVPTSGDPSRSIDIVALRGEYRADAILLTNATAQPSEAQLELSGVPGAPRPEWLRVSGIEWTDTQQHTPVADALVDASFTAGAFRVTVPAGMTRKVWLTIDAAKLAPGTYRGTLTVRSTGSSTVVAATFRVSPVAMARPRLSLGTWDYTNGNGKLGITPRNRDAAIALMRTHFVDSPWATRAVLPWPKADDFDTTGRLVRPLDFRALDDWIGMWAGARRFYVAIEAGASFAGALIQTSQFDERLASWGRAVAGHLRALGLSSKQAAFLLVDEPRRHEQNAVIAAWARVLKTTAPDISLFEDPIWARPDQVSPSDAFTLVDELCVHLGVYSRGGENVSRYVEQPRAAGQRVWVYQTSGPVRLLDPSAYFRMQAWHAFRM
jgi:hypothetical protein